MFAGLACAACLGRSGSILYTESIVLVFSWDGSYTHRQVAILLQRNVKLMKLGHRGRGLRPVPRTLHSKICSCVYMKSYFAGPYPTVYALQVYTSIAVIIATRVHRKY